ncbi:acyltransferase family protein [Larkinella ripae]
MPVFFLLSGFFTAALTIKYGWQGMIKNRIKRILLPFIVFWCLIFPLTYIGLRVAATTSFAQGWVAFRALLNGHLDWVGPIHLWFMYYLLWLCAVIWLLHYAIDRIAGERFKNWAMQQFERVMQSRFYLIVPLMITFPTLLLMSDPWTITPTSFKPMARPILFFGLFFGYGWLLQYRPHLLNRFTHRPRLNVTLGSIFAVAYLVILFHPESFPSPKIYFASVMLMSAGCIWSFIAGLIGLGLRYNTSSTFITVLAQASFWMYLVHLPLTIWIPQWLLPWAAPVAVKFGVTLGSTLLITFGSYLLLVRGTFIGHFLNGRTYPPLWNRPVHYNHNPLEASQKV